VEKSEPINLQEEKEEEYSGVDLASFPIVMEDKSVQVDVASDVAALRRENIALKRQLRTVQSATKKWEETFVWLKSSCETFHFFTGFTLDQFNVLFTSLGDDVNNLNFWGAESGVVQRSKKVIPECQLVVTLWRLRRGLYLQELAYHFGLNRHTV
jgi:hypothetical protein